MLGVRDPLRHYYEPLNDSTSHAQCLRRMQNLQESKVLDETTATRFDLPGAPAMSMSGMLATAPEWHSAPRPTQYRFSSLAGEGNRCILPPPLVLELVTLYANLELGSPGMPSACGVGFCQGTVYCMGIN